MSEVLIAIGVGSPHDFISSGRRARDIWFGSRLLADLTLAVAYRLRRLGATVIVPALPAQDMDEAALVADTDRSARNGNMILVALPGERHLEANRVAQEAMQVYWSLQAARTFATVAPIVDEDGWRLQTQRCPVDLFFPPVPLPGRLKDKNNKKNKDKDKKDYPDARRRAMQALASHKLQRRFRPNPAQGAVPKSSLDGVTESVLRHRGEGAGSRAETLLLRQAILLKHAELNFLLRLGLSEELDATGLMKRAAVPRRLASVSGVAVAPWVRGVAAGPLRNVLGDVASLIGGSRSDADAEGRGIEERFVHDGSLLLDDGVRRQIREREKALASTRRSRGEIAAAGRSAIEAELLRLKKIQPLVSKLHRAAGVPSPYYVVISADGDEVGRQIDDYAHCSDAHTEISAALTGYAEAAAALIEARETGGTVIYAGGEDLLALLPLDKAFDAIRAMKQCYAEAWQTVVKKLSAPRVSGNPSRGTPVVVAQTLSVGIAIAHCHDAFDAALQAAREGEQAAKRARLRDREILGELIQGRSYCTIRWMPRQGTDFELCGPQAVLDRLDTFAALHRADAIADAIGYVLLRLSETYAGWEPRAQSHRDRHEALQLELQHLLLRRKATAAARTALGEAVQSLLSESAGDSVQCLQRLGQELVLARRIAECRRQAEPGTEDLVHEQ